MTWFNWISVPIQVGCTLGTVYLSFLSVREYLHAKKTRRRHMQMLSSGMSPLDILKQEGWTL
ncbi:MAG: hypothetical protein E6R04_03055 [Spirochaetes bacterium]|nr:MAG: hypothetical protein E6R04_03055 [Spirochaetota bacterium]